MLTTLGDGDGDGDGDEGGEADACGLAGCVLAGRIGGAVRVGA